jgi:hypothetical protein
MAVESNPLFHPEDKEQFVAVLKGKGAHDLLDRPFAGRTCLIASTRSSDLS